MATLTIIAIALLPGYLCSALWIGHWPEVSESLGTADALVVGASGCRVQLGFRVGSVGFWVGRVY